jgi:hypothetical protein
MSDRPELEVAEKYGLSLRTNGAQDPVLGTFPEQQEQERSLYLTPAVRNEEHLFLDIAALLDGHVPEPPKPRVSSAPTTMHSSTPDKSTCSSAIPNPGKRSSPKPPKLRPSKTAAAS